MEDLKKLMISPTLDFHSVVKAVQNGGTKMSLVVDKKNKLLGTITDGDIRRTLLKKSSLQIMAKDMMNSNPITVRKNTSDKNIKDLMKERNLFHLPVLNDDGEVIKLRLLHELLDVKKNDNTIFILAGGFGRRLFPLTRNIPKPMLKIGEVPILERIINRFKDQGFHNFTVSTHYLSKQIINHFDNGKKLGVNIDYVIEDTPLGTAGSLGLINKKKITNSIIVINADIMSQLNFVELLKFHKSNFNEITLCTKEYSFQIPFGVINANNGNFINLEEKPVKYFNINAGIYVIEPSLLRFIDGKKYIDMTTFINDIMNSNIKVNTFPIYEEWDDLGSKGDLDRIQSNIDKKND